MSDVLSTESNVQTQAQDSSQLTAVSQLTAYCSPSVSHLLVLTSRLQYAYRLRSRRCLYIYNAKLRNYCNVLELVI